MITSTINEIAYLNQFDQSQQGFTRYFPLKYLTSNGVENTQERELVSHLSRHFRLATREVCITTPS